MQETLTGRYFGKGGPLFGLYLRTAILTLITLGIYRFWAKTRIRKYIWSATSAGDDSFEYTGTGLEKLLGFLVAIVILAVYLGLVQMLLVFLGLNVMTEPKTQAQAIAQILGFYVFLLAMLPLILFAQYRARRYRMARTRWRGIRFGMDNGAWGYALRALGHYLLTILTLGLLLPRQTFYLEKFMVDRSWYGDGRFEQHGRWQSLFPGLKHVFIGFGVLMVGGVLGALQLFVLAAVAGTVGYVWLVVGAIYYRVFAFNYLTRNKVLDASVTFDAQARTGRIIMIYVVGVIGIAVLALLGVGLIGALMAGSLAALSGGMVGLGLTQIMLLALLYTGFFLALGGLSMVLILQPVIEHYVTSTSAHNADHLDTIRQRAADAGADAEGFADALDVGGAI